jgi:hypothetical protein
MTLIRWLLFPVPVPQLLGMVEEDIEVDFCEYPSRDSCKLNCDIVKAESKRQGVLGVLYFRSIIQWAVRLLNLCKEEILELATQTQCSIQELWPFGDLGNVELEQINYLDDENVYCQSSEIYGR